MRARSEKRKAKQQSSDNDRAIRICDESTSRFIEQWIFLGWSFHTLDGRFHRQDFYCVQYGTSRHSTHYTLVILQPTVRGMEFKKIYTHAHLETFLVCPCSCNQVHTLTIDNSLLVSTIGVSCFFTFWTSASTLET